MDLFYFFSRSEEERFPQQSNPAHSMPNYNNKQVWTFGYLRYAFLF